MAWLAAFTEMLDSILEANHRDSCGDVSAHYGLFISISELVNKAFNPTI